MQRTPLWFAERANKITASNVGACLGLVSYTSRKEAYLRATGNAAPITDGTESETKNEACLYGIRNEPVAVKCYEGESGNIVQDAGFVRHPQHNWIGASPDGFIGKEGMLEVKCPWYHKVPHGKIPMHYYLQMLLQLECTERKWCDFYSWTPNASRTFRVLPDPTLFNWLFENYLVGLYNAIEKKRGDFLSMKAGEKKMIKEKIQESMDSHIVGTQRTITDMFRMPCPEPDPFSTFSNEGDEDGSNDLSINSPVVQEGQAPFKRQRLLVVGGTED